jgi:hypothetical protein
MDVDVKSKEGILFKTTTKKSIFRFIESLKENAPEFHFGIRYVLDMKAEYSSQGVETDEAFALYQVVLCNFARSYQSIMKNSNRAAVLLEPKQIIVYNDNGDTAVDYLPFTEEFIKQALPDDKDFAWGLRESCQRIIQLIRASL